MIHPELVLYSGGHKGTEAEFGRDAERWGIPEVTFSFAGHDMERGAGVRVLTAEELAKGDVSMDFVARKMGRTYHSGELIRRVLQSIFHMVVNANQVFAVGWIQADGTVRGGTGWGVELAKFFNRPICVFDQAEERWFRWDGLRWVAAVPEIEERPFAATGTRQLTAAGRRAIRELFERSFGPAAAPRKSAKG
jgi:hypothetical protein